MVLQKHWNNGATGDSADLSITGGLTDPATATSTVTTATGSTFTDTTNQATTAVHTGDKVTLTEDLPAANTGSYDTTLTCDNGAQPDADGTFTITAAMVATGVTCTFSNTRQQATMTLTKAVGDLDGRGHGCSEDQHASWEHRSDDLDRAHQHHDHDPGPLR